MSLLEYYLHQFLFIAESQQPHDSSFIILTLGKVTFNSGPKLSPAYGNMRDWLAVSCMTELHDARFLCLSFPIICLGKLGTSQR